MRSWTASFTTPIDSTSKEKPCAQGSRPPPTPKASIAPTDKVPTTTAEPGRKTKIPPPAPHPRVDQGGPQAPPTPCATLRAEGAPLRGWVPPVYSLDNPPAGIHSLLLEVCTHSTEITIFTDNYSIDCETPRTIQSALSAASTRLPVCDALGKGGGAFIGLRWRIDRPAVAISSARPPTASGTAGPGDARRTGAAVGAARLDRAAARQTSHLRRAVGAGDRKRRSFPASS